jgi:hypothetical protein
MKHLLSILVAHLFLFATVMAQPTILPVENAELCPNYEITFTVTIAGTVLSVVPWTNGPLVLQGPFNINTSGGNTTFNFRGMFRDANIKQVFRVNYSTPTNSSLVKDFEFKKIKSLYYNNPANCAIILPNSSSINAPACQQTATNLNFNNIQWQTFGESPELCFGSITSYEYLLPAGWKLGTDISNGTSWLQANNNVTITSNLLSGGQIAIRPTNSCGAGFQNGQTPRFININRTNQPVLKTNGATSLIIFCGDASAKTFTIENAGACITGYEWLVANKGWFDANGNLITSNITTTTPSLTLYPSCNSANPPQSVSVKIKAGAEEMTSTVNVSLSAAAPQLQISGANEFCTSASYSVPVSPSCGASVTWSLEYLNNHTNVASLSCTNCQTTTVSKLNDGTALLRATVTFPGCNTTGIYEKYIGVGVPVIRGWYNGPTNSQQPLASSNKFEFNWNDACYTTQISTNMDITANSTVVWEDAGNSGGVTWYQNGNNLNFYFSDLNQWAYFRVTSTNSCGTKSWLYRFRSVSDNCPGGVPLLIMLSPNPTEGNVTVELKENKDTKKLKEIVEIRVLDRSGMIRQKWNYGQSGIAQSRQFNIGNLPADIYTILVFDGVNWAASKLIKQ